MKSRQLIESEMDDRLEQAFDLQHLAKVSDANKRLDKEIKLAAAVCAKEFDLHWGGTSARWKPAFNQWYQDEFLDHPALEKALDLSFELGELLDKDPDDGSIDDKVYDTVYRLARAKLKETYA